MATVWRLAPPAYARQLNGEGSRLVGGRWNSPGRPVVYTSSHLSLSVLEVFVHFPAEVRDNLPELYAIQIAVPDNAESVEISAAAFEGLMASPDAVAACRAVGDDWLLRASALVLSAPSVVVPEDINIMLNPTHAEMQRVSIVSTRKFHFDPRLIRSV